jgi:hypothetical protein
VSHTPPCIPEIPTHAKKKEKKKEGKKKKEKKTHAKCATHMQLDPYPYFPVLSV